MIGTIQKVFKRDDTKPGAVVFSDGTKLTTFSDALIATAVNGIGQLAEYTTEQKGKYTNLATITLKGTPPASAPQGGESGTKVVDFGSAVVASAVKDLTAAVRELTSQLARIGLVSKLPPFVPEPGQQSTPQSEPQVDPVEAAQQKLADHIGSPDAAEAMFESLKKKHGKSPEKLAKAVADLLKAHGVA